MKIPPRIRRFIAKMSIPTVYVVGIEQLPPNPEGPTYRYEIALKFTGKITSCPEEETVRSIADEILETIDDIDHPIWQGADELWIQIYAPGVETNAGACATAHWYAEGGYEEITTREYMFFT